MFSQDMVDGMCIRQLWERRCLLPPKLQNFCEWTVYIFSEWKFFSEGSLSVRRSPEIDFSSCKRQRKCFGLMRCEGNIVNCTQAVLFMCCFYLVRISMGDAVLCVFDAARFTNMIIFCLGWQKDHFIISRHISRAPFICVKILLPVLSPADK